MSNIFQMAADKKSALEKALGQLPSQQKKKKVVAKPEVKAEDKNATVEVKPKKSAFEPSLDFKERRRKMREAERNKLLAEDAAERAALLAKDATKSK